MSINHETNENLLRFCDGQKFATIYADPPWRFQNRTGTAKEQIWRASIV